jgi:hypothetical protein
MTDCDQCKVTIRSQKLNVDTDAKNKVKINANVTIIWPEQKTTIDVHEPTMKKNTFNKHDLKPKSTPKRKPTPKRELTPKLKQELNHELKREREPEQDKVIQYIIKQKYDILGIHFPKNDEQRQFNEEIFENSQNEAINNILKIVQESQRQRYLEQEFKRPEKRSRRTTK